MIDRAFQMFYKFALDPIAETTGDPNSYDFRLGRSTADAIGRSGYSCPGKSRIKRIHHPQADIFRNFFCLGMASLKVQFSFISSIIFTIL